MRATTIILAITFALTSAEAALVDDLGHPDSNILTRENRDRFTFTGHPTIQTYGSPTNVADEQSNIDVGPWEKYAYSTKVNGNSVAYLKVDLKHKYYIRAFAVNGYPDGGRKPRGKWYLEGSNDEIVWKMVGIGEAYQWLNPGTYPFLDSQIVKCKYPSKYRYYRVIARNLEHNYMNIQNLGLFT